MEVVWYYPSSPRLQQHNELSYSVFRTSVNYSELLGTVAVCIVEYPDGKYK